METALAIPAITTETALGIINVALTKEGISIQTISDIETALVYNEDNLPVLRSFQEEVRRILRVVEETRKKEKDPYFQAGKRIDEAAKVITDQLNNILRTPNEKVTKMSQDIERRSREAEAERQRKQQILSGIDSNVLSFSHAISECKTDTELVDIERKINLEKGQKKKYAEFIDQAVEKYSTLTVQLTQQKERVREYQQLEKKRLEAERKNDDEALLKIQEQQLQLDTKIDEAKVTVQESAINQTLNTVIDAKEIMPEVKTRFRMWKWEVQDIQQTVKKMPSWTKIETVDEKIIEYMKASKDSWKESKQEEVIVNGIRFYLEKTY